jgi:hypothetical protein
MKTSAYVQEFTDAFALQHYISEQEKKGFYLISCTIDSTGKKILAVLIFNASLTTSPYNYQSK